jgi:hypothetical protein
MKLNMIMKRQTTQCDMLPKKYMYYETQFYHTSVRTSIHGTDGQRIIATASVAVAAASSSLAVHWHIREPLQTSQETIGYQWSKFITILGSIMCKQKACKAANVFCLLPENKHAHETIIPPMIHQLDRREMVGDVRLAD